MKIKCPYCEKFLNTPDNIDITDYIGETVKCEECGQNFNLSREDIYIKTINFSNKSTYQMIDSVKNINNMAGSKLTKDEIYQKEDIKLNLKKQKEEQDLKTIGIGCLILIALIVIFSLFSSLFSSLSSSPLSSQTQKETRKEQIEKIFSVWDGSNYGLTKHIKRSMNDPDSYEHVETVYWDKGDYLLVKTTFRGKNAFGGVVKNWVTAKVNLQGNVTGVISKGP